jgi:hypothetical protein
VDVRPARAEGVVEAAPEVPGNQRDGAARPCSRLASHKHRTTVAQMVELILDASGSLLAGAESLEVRHPRGVLLRSRLRFTFPAWRRPGRVCSAAALDPRPALSSFSLPPYLSPPSRPIRHVPCRG